MSNPTTPQRPTSRIDRRVERTRKALREALLSLIEEKGYDTVTVEEVTQRANVGRATFYLHYRDKEDVLLEQLHELARDRVQLLSEVPLVDWDITCNPPYPPLIKVFQHAAENADLYRVILWGEGAASITKRLRSIIISALNLLIQDNEEPGSVSLSAQIPVDFLATYIAGALIGSIAWWLEQPDPPDPHAMTQLFQRMFIPGAAQMLGLVQKK